jgi:phenylpropionate dioxygenase-like ring-hydroxylating dioxygenase large terminal subunit
MTPESSGLIERLRNLAEAPFERATTLPPALYVSEEIHRRELEKIFATEWHCPGLAAEIPNPGDYLVFSIGAQPLFSIRGEDGTIRTFANVCRHRMMKLLSGRGHAKAITCPYHAWTYDLSGRLIGAPHMKQTPGFRKEAVCLPEIHTEIWEGWIYITLNDGAASVAEHLNPLLQVVAKYDMASYVPAAHDEFTWRTNWKLLCENFMEGYHLPVAHRATLGPHFPVTETTFPVESFAAFTYQTFTKSGTAPYGRAHPNNSRLADRWRITSVMPTIFPAHMYVLAPDHLWYLTLQPKGVGEVRVRFGAAIAPEVDASLGDGRDAWLKGLIDFFDRVNEEDRIVVEGIFEGANSPSADVSPLSWLEREIHDFARYLGRKLADAGERASIETSAAQ